MASVRGFMREDLERLRRQLERAKPWAKGGRVAIRVPVLEALLGVVDAGDRLSGYGVGTGLPKARAELTAAMLESTDADRELASLLGADSTEPIEIGGGVEP